MKTKGARVDIAFQFLSSIQQVSLKIGIDKRRSIEQGECTVERIIALALLLGMMIELELSNTQILDGHDTDQFVVDGFSEASAAE